MQKLLKKNLARQIQQSTGRIIHHDQTEFSPEMTIGVIFKYQCN